MSDAKARSNTVRIEAFSDGMIAIVVVAIALINRRALVRLPPYATPGLCWSSAHLLFWTSLISLSTAMMGQNPFEPPAVRFCGAIMSARSPT
jgi:uncharacterized membrane protein